ncbi:sulfur carrier protein ThiS [Nocardioides rubriscoriae]|uniref:sulfur carrier protein ThiS n=1 Tax=Nocardioides rubriscoriae TaxID=642762 RepID=UPI0011DFE020|nr:sulfur carrier protein ThiS [Nocardioides rubriscoriae]
MHLHVNGRPHELPDGTVLTTLLTTLLTTVAPEPRGVAVAVNDRVVRAAEWPVTRLHEGDRVEVVTAHQGG